MNLYLPQWCLIMFASGLVYTLPDVSMFACPGAINDDTYSSKKHALHRVCRCGTMHKNGSHTETGQTDTHTVFTIHVHIKCPIQHVKFE